MQVIKDLQADAHIQMLSSSKIADMTGLDKKTVNSIMTGDNDNPKIQTVEAIAHALGAEIVYSTVDSKAAVKSGDVSYYRTLLAAMSKEIEYKNLWLKWITRIAIGLACFLFIESIIAMLIIGV